MNGHVLVERQDGILQITMNRPEKKNALTVAMYEAMTAAMSEAAADDAVRVVVIAGTEACFTAGNDLSDFLDGPPAGQDSPVFHFLKALVTARKPVIAVVHGPAVGIGTTMLLHCDLVYAGASARLQLPFVNLGLSPEAASSLLLPQLMGHRRAAELLLLGEAIDADTALQWGLVNAVRSDRELDGFARHKAQQLAAQPPSAVQLSKSLMKRATLAAIEEAMAEEGRHFLARLQSPEAREAMQAFLERRPADFSRLVDDGL
jgi:enoyl-CoA hydratase/carnithine racemase